MVSYHDITCLPFLKIEPQVSRPMDASAAGHWRIGQGFMCFENMFLVRLDSVSRGSWQPEIWVHDSVPGVLSPTPMPWAIATSEDNVKLGRGQLRSPPSSAVLAPVPTATVFTTPGDSQPNTKPAGLIPLNSQQHPGWYDIPDGYNMPICNGQNDVPVHFSPILVPQTLERLYSRP